MILKDLRHENIVRFIDKFKDDTTKRFYIVMEYCAGGDLAQLIKKNKHERQYLSEDHIWKMFFQICVALYQCHTH